MIRTYDQNELRAWFAHRTGSIFAPDLVCLADEVDGIITFMVGFDHYNGSSIWIHSAKGTKPVASREFLHAIFHYAFDVAKVKVLIGPLGSGNAPAIRLNKHLGFKIAATLEGAHPDGALLLMTMAREECRFLNQPRSQNGRQQQSTTSA